MRPFSGKQQQKKYVNGRVYERQGIDPIKNKRLQEKHQQKTPQLKKNDSTHERLVYWFRPIF
jgi:hypothetical protein